MQLSYLQSMAEDDQEKAKNTTHISEAIYAQLSEKGDYGQENIQVTLTKYVEVSPAVLKNKSSLSCYVFRVKLGLRKERLTY